MFKASVNFHLRGRVYVVAAGHREDGPQGRFLLLTKIGRLAVSV